jgi:hypothetical protein
MKWSSQVQAGRTEVRHGPDGVQVVYFLCNLVYRPVCQFQMRAVFFKIILEISQVQVSWQLRFK